MSFVASRLARLVAVLLAVTFLSFLLLNLLPGDPAQAILGFNATEEGMAALRVELGLDKPIITRYISWLGGVVQGDLGRSYLTNFGVLDSIKQRLPATLQLLVMAQVIALAGALPLAIASARRASGRFDRVTTTLSFGMLSLPVFVTAVFLIALFAVKLKWLPATGFTPLGEDLSENLRSTIMPAFSLAIGQLAVYLRLLRADLITTLQQDFIDLARARGFSTRRIMWRHALRPSSIALITIAGINIGAMIGGTIIVETLFAIPGIGRHVIESILSRDYLMVQGAVVLIATGYVVVNFAVDLIYAVVDPRIRHHA